MPSYGNGLIQPSIDTLQGTGNGQTFLWNNNTQSWYVDYPLGILRNNVLVGTRRYLAFTGSGILSIVDDALNNKVVVNIGASGSSGGAPADPSYLLLDNSGTIAGLTNYRTLSVSSSLSLTDGGPSRNLNLNVNPDTTTQRVEVMVNSIGGYFTRKRLNFIGPITMTDDSTNNRINLTLNTPDANVKYITFEQVSGLPNSRQLIPGTGITLVESASNNTVTINAAQATSNAGVHILQNGISIATSSTLNISGSAISNISNDSVNNRINLTIDSITSFTATGGTVRRSAQDHANDIISVKDFGAFDSTTIDSSTSFQNAFNYAGLTGKRVFVPTGTYLVSNIIAVDITIIGDPTGTVILSNNAFLSCMYLSGEVYISGIQFGVTDNAQTAMIADVASATPSSVSLLTCTDSMANIIIENCKGLGSYGFLNMTTTASPFLARLKLHNCDIVSYRQAVIFENVYTVDIKECLFSPLIGFDPAAAIIFNTDTYLTEVALRGTAITITRCENVAIIDTRIDNYHMAIYGVYLTTVAVSSISSNFLMSLSQIVDCQQGLIFSFSVDNVSVRMTISENLFKIQNAIAPTVYIPGGALVFTTDGSTGGPIDLRIVIDSNNFSFSSYDFIYCAMTAYIIITNNHFSNWGGGPQFRKISTSSAFFGVQNQNGTNIDSVMISAITMLVDTQGVSYSTCIISENFFENSYYNGCAITMGASNLGNISNNIFRNTKIYFSYSPTIACIVSNNLFDAASRSLGTTPNAYPSISFDSTDSVVNVYMSNNVCNNLIIVFGVIFFV